MNEKRFTTVDGVRLASWACAFFVVAGFFLLVAAFGVGCDPKQGAARATYEGQLLSCTDRAKTYEEEQTCWTSVREAWAKDAGADQ